MQTGLLRFHQVCFRVPLSTGLHQERAYTYSGISCPCLTHLYFSHQDTSFQSSDIPCFWPISNIRFSGSSALLGTGNTRIGVHPWCKPVFQGSNTPRHKSWIDVHAIIGPRFKQKSPYTLNKILVEVGQVNGQSWAKFVNISQKMFLVKGTRRTNIQRGHCWSSWPMTLMWLRTWLSATHS